MTLTDEIKKFCQKQIDLIDELQKKRKFMPPLDSKLYLGKKMAYLHVIKEFERKEEKE